MLRLFVRLAREARTQELSIAVVAVGSVLYKPRFEYKDVDLVLLPMEEDDLDEAEGFFNEFCATQAEVLKTKNGEPCRREYDPGNWNYCNSTLWDFVFGQSDKYIECFVRKSWARMDLTHFRADANHPESETNPHKRPYAYMVLP